MGLRGEDEVVNVDDEVLFFSKQEVQILEHLCQHVGIHSVTAKQVLCTRRKCHTEIKEKLRSAKLMDKLRNKN